MNIPGITFDIEDDPGEYEYLYDAGGCLKDVIRIVVENLEAVSLHT